MQAFRAARDFLLAHRDDYDAAYQGFTWPRLDHFNWALDWFDGVLASEAESRDRLALWIVDSQSGQDIRLTFADLSRRSNQAANFLRAAGVKRGDRLLLLLGNIAPLWEIMLAAIKLGVVIIPATPLLTAEELRDRVARGPVAHVVTGIDQQHKFNAWTAGEMGKIVVGAGEVSAGWRRYDPAGFPADFAADSATPCDEPLLLYFTSGTTALPKLVQHSHSSYPVGHLSTMYWIGLKPGDVHLNVSSPGWAKHAWSSFFAPWNAGATICIVNQVKFEAKVLLDAIIRCGVTTLCAPPTVWRILVQEDLAQWRTNLRELVGAGEPLNPEVIDHVREAWGLTIRDGFGQTETTCLIGNTPGQMLKPGSMGRPLPGYHVVTLDQDGQLASEGEVCLSIGNDRPTGLMAGYQRAEDGELVGADGLHYHTGDVACHDDDGYLTFVGRADDVFKCSDYRISPFELESVLIEHPAVAEAAVVPSPDALRLSVPKAFVSLVPGATADRETASSILHHVHAKLAPFKRVRLLEFVDDLPKTISGKIRRVQLKGIEYGKLEATWPQRIRFSEDDFPDLKQQK